MGIVWENTDVLDMIDEFGVNCLYFQARIAPDTRYGITKLESDAVHGFRYDAAESVRLIRTSISQRIALSDHGRTYQGGATFTVPPVAFVGGVLVTPKIYERVFLGDVIVVQGKAMRDWDVLKKGYRDQLYAFDVKAILSVNSVDAAGVEKTHLYGRDYTLQIAGVEVTATQRSGQDVWDIAPSATYPIISSVQIVWRTVATDAGTPVVPASGETYTVEFLCSPNYVVMPLADKTRATEENDLPKTIQCVKRAFFNTSKSIMDTVDTGQSIDDTDTQVY